MTTKKIRGNTVGTTTPRPDFNQSNPKKADYIKNRPLDRLLPAISADDENKILRVKDGKWEAVPHEELITPQMFGAKADGVTDDSEAIRAAIAALPKENGTLYFPPGVYIHGDGITTGESYGYIANDKGELYRPNVNKDNNYASANVGRDIRFYFDGYTNLNILGYGAEIRSNDGNGQTRNNAMFMFYNCHGVKIKGLKLDGRRQERGIDQDDYIPGPINEFLQCNITFSYHCSDILIEDVTSVNSVHDGISIGWTNSNVKIINCVCDNAQRNGIAICGCENVVIEGCQCNDNGVSGDGYRGIAPKCGIDIEAHPITDPSGIITSKNANTNVHVSNCNIENNEVLGITVSNWANTVTIDGCYFKNNRTNVYDKGEEKQTENIYIRNSTLINSRLHTEFTVSENNYIENHYVKGDPYLANGYSCDDIDSRLDAKYICRNNTFKFVVDDESEVPEGAYMGIRIWNNTEFIGNRVIGAFSIGKLYPVTLLGKVFKDNVFERVYTEINGYDALKEWDSVNNDWSYARSRIYYREKYFAVNDETGEYELSDSYRNNNDFGEYYTYGRFDMNREILTDTSITKSYSLLANAGSVFRIHPLATTKLNAFYLGQEEEVIFPSWDYTRIQHVLKHESLHESINGKSIVSVYIDSTNGFVYVQFNVSHPNFTVTRHADNSFKQAVFDEPIEDVTDKVKSGEIKLLSSMGTYMIRSYGNSRNFGYGMLPGTMYYDTSLQMPLWYYQNGNTKKWLDKDGNDASRFYGFTIDGVCCTAKHPNETNEAELFSSWVKSKRNDLRLRASDIRYGSGSLLVTADGSKVLCLREDADPSNNFDGVVWDTWGISERTYYLVDYPNANPDYSNVPVFWNGTELVTTPIYKGEVEEA